EELDGEPNWTCTLGDGLAGVEERRRFALTQMTSFGPALASASFTPASSTASLVQVTLTSAKPPASPTGELALAPGTGIVVGHAAPLVLDSELGRDRPAGPNPADDPPPEDEPLPEEELPEDGPEDAEGLPLEPPFSFEPPWRLLSLRPVASVFEPPK